MQEIWKEIELEGFYYQVSNTGRVKGKRKELKQRLNTDGYLEITYGDGKHNRRTSTRVHRLVALLFIENPRKLPEVNHKDFDRTNNNVDNLMWCTHEENIQYSALYNQEVMSLKSRGENNGRSILSEEDVLKIRKLHSDGFNISQIAIKYNRGWQTINHIIKGTTWNHI